jgi:hypothetical protein
MVLPENPHKFFRKPWRNAWISKISWG